MIGVMIDSSNVLKCLLIDARRSIHFLFSDFGY